MGVQHGPKHHFNVEGLGGWGLGLGVGGGGGGNARRDQKPEKFLFWP